MGNKTQEIARLEKLSQEYEDIRDTVRSMARPEILTELRSVTCKNSTGVFAVVTKFAIMGDVSVEAKGYYHSRLNGLWIEKREAELGVTSEHKTASGDLWALKHYEEIVEDIARNGSKGD